MFAFVGLSINCAKAQNIAAEGTTSVFRCSDNTVMSVGSNDWGQHGVGTMMPSSTPVQASSLSGITAVSAGLQYSLFLKNDGTVWSCGINSAGELGDGTTTNRLTPVQVSSLSGIIAIAGGFQHSLFVKNDGTVWACGANANGQLGDGTTTQRTTPVQVSSLSGIIAIGANYSHSLFLKNDGTVWACGLNGNGELGDGTTTQRNTPVQVSSLSGITAIAEGWQHSLFLKNDGTVWACGDNGFGQLGDGTYTSSNTPVQAASSLSGITAVASGLYHSLFMKNDGTVWACGNNDFGQLGDGTLTERTPPVQVTGLCVAVTAIQENSMESFFSVYPNPSYGILQLNFDNMPSSKGELEIYNVYGEKVYTVSNIKQQMQIDISALPKGIYFVKVYDGTKIYNQKIIVQ